MPKRNKMDKFFNWFNKNRRTIGFTVGGLCLLSSVNYLLDGNAVGCVLYLLLGIMIIVDARNM